MGRIGSRGTPQKWPSAAQASGRQLQAACTPHPWSAHLPWTRSQDSGMSSGRAEAAGGEVDVMRIKWPALAIGCPVAMLKSMSVATPPMALTVRAMVR